MALPEVRVCSRNQKALVSLRNEAYVEDGEDRMRSVLDIHLVPLADGAPAVHVALSADDMLRLLSGSSVPADVEVTGAWIGAV